MLIDTSKGMLKENNANTQVYKEKTAKDQLRAPLTLKVLITLEGLKYKDSIFIANYLVLKDSLKYGIIFTLSGIKTVKAT